MEAEINGASDKIKGRLKNNLAGVDFVRAES
jgi:hypothetical protein